jgi:hypothetical protein
MDRAQPAWYIQETTRLMEVDFDLPLSPHTDIDAIEVQQIDGVVDVQEGFQLEVSEDQIVAAWRRRAGEAWGLSGLLVRQVIR